MVEDLRSMYAFSLRHVGKQYSATKLQARYSFSNLFFSIGVKVRLVKAMVFQVVMRGCESWTVKKAES